MLATQAHLASTIAYGVLELYTEYLFIHSSLQLYNKFHCENFTIDF